MNDSAANVAAAHKITLHNMYYAFCIHFIIILTISLHILQEG